MGEPFFAVERLRSDSVISKALLQKQTLIDNRKREGVYCLRRNKCCAEAMVACPLLKGNCVYGGIAVYFKLDPKRES